MKTRRLSVVAAAGLAAAAAPALAQQTLYALQSPTFPSLLTLDKDTGNVLDSEVVTGAEALFGGLAMDAAGDLYSIDGFNDADSDRLFRIDPATGAGEVVGDTGFNWNFRAVDVDPTSDTLYATTDNRLYTVDRATGAATLVANISGPSLDQLTTFAIDNNGVAYGTDIGETGLFRIDLSTGAAEHLGDLGPAGVRAWFNDLTFDENGVLYGAHQQDGAVYTIDIDEAERTLAFFGSYVGLEFSPVDGGCPADLDNDGDADVNDFFLYLDLFEAGDPRADITGDGSVDVNDFFAYLDLFEQGC